jgi:DNA primase
MIPNDFIQTLLSRVDIVDVIDRFVPLKKAGANYQACCPFHSEKTPSFTVSPTKQFYHCFGCGAHGTAIGFLIEYGGKSFPDAVEELARDAGLEVPRVERPGEAERREQTSDLGGLMVDAARYYRAALKESPRAIDYLKERGLTGTIAAKYGIGYAPDAWQPLAGAIANYPDKALEIAGLVITGEGGKRYDRFRDRIMFPIHDSRGQVIGFGGRVLGAGEPKYLNSPETPLFSKGRELYGLFQARNAIRAAGKVVVVEGYMDVVALAQHGVEYVVATLGTATTPVHVQKLFRLTENVVFCFDGDAAGRKAAWRALENAIPVLADGRNAAFLFLPEGMDPDDYVRRHGKAAFEALAEKATPLSEFLLGELTARHSHATEEDRAALVHAAKPLLAQMTAPVLAALVRKRLAERIGLPEAELRSLLGLGTMQPGSQVRSDRRDEGARPGPAPGARGIVAKRPAPSLVRELIQALLLQPELAHSVTLPGSDEGGIEEQALAALAGFCGAAAPPLTTAGVMQHFAGTAHEPVLVRALATAEDHAITGDQAAEHLRAGVARYWQLAQRAGRTAPETAAASAEEAERLRQLEIVRRAGRNDAPGVGRAE